MYNAYITRLKNVRQHSNADRLQCGMCFESHVIVGLDLKEGDLVAYFPTDGQLSEEFATAHNLVRVVDENGVNIGGYLDPVKRNIKSIKLRGEMSDGLLLPLSTLSNYVDITTLKEGDIINTLGGTEICCKYIPSGSIRAIQSDGNKVKNKQKKEKVIEYPFFKEHIDTQQLQYNLGKFQEGDLVTISLKLHGTSHRESYTLKEEVKSSFLDKILRRTPKIKRNWETVSGSRRVVLSNYDGGYYGTNKFREECHELFKDKLYHGETVYLEIVGYTGENTTIMPSVSNSKVSDKAFTKRFGKVTEFTYGCEKGQRDYYVYRMTMTNDQGETVEYPTWLAQYRCEMMGIKFVPVYETFFFTTKEDLMERVNRIIDGEDGTGMTPDPVGKSHVMEGVVVKIENRKVFTALKHKNWYFKVLEGLAKDEAVQPDIEELEEVLS